MQITCRHCQQPFRAKEQRNFCSDVCGLAHHQTMERELGHALCAPHRSGKVAWSDRQYAYLTFIQMRRRAYEQLTNVTNFSYEELLEIERYMLFEVTYTGEVNL